MWFVTAFSCIPTEETHAKSRIILISRRSNLSSEILLLQAENISKDLFKVIVNYLD